MTNLACSRCSVSRARRSVGSELNCTLRSTIWTPATGYDQSEALPWSERWYVISMESSDVRTCRRIFVVFRHWSAFCPGFNRFTEHNCKSTYRSPILFILRVYTNLTFRARWLEPMLLENCYVFFSAPQQTLYGVSIRPQWFKRWITLSTGWISI